MHAPPPQAIAPPSPAASSREVLSCEVGGRTLRLTAEGEALVYHYGTPDKEELRIVGRAADGNVHYRRRDSAVEGRPFSDAQVRFSRGPYNYIVVWDIHSTSYPKGAHFVVAKGMRTLAVQNCTSYRLDPAAFDFGSLPTDGDQYGHEMF
jgi:hypothetical protein